MIKCYVSKATKPNVILWWQNDLLHPRSQSKGGANIGKEYGYVCCNIPRGGGTFKLTMYMHAWPEVFIPW